MVYDPMQYVRALYLSCICSSSLIKAQKIFVLRFEVKSKVSVLILNEMLK